MRFTDSKSIARLLEVAPAIGQPIDFALAWKLSICNSRIILKQLVKEGLYASSRTGKSNATTFTRLSGTPIKSETYSEFIDRLYAEAKDDRA